MGTSHKSPDWPELSETSATETYAALHLWSQVVGKICLATAPWLNHSWHLTLHLTARGLSTPVLVVDGHDFQIEFDFVDHILWLRASNGHSRQVLLKPMSVAAFFSRVMVELAELGLRPRVSDMPTEVPDAIPFEQDSVTRQYDRSQANTLWRALLRSHEVFAYFRTAFLGKVSPVHFFWGGFDLAVTRFSGRRAPTHPGGIPHLSDRVTREAYSHEVSSAGFWPGSGAVDYPAYYSYTYPQPAGFSSAPVLPRAAFFSAEMGEFILPYRAVQSADDPAQELLDFLQSTYAAAAELGHWNRGELECPLGRIGVPRAV